MAGSRRRAALNELDLEAALVITARSKALLDADPARFNAASEALDAIDARRAALR